MATLTEQTKKIQTVSGDIFLLSNIKENGVFKGYFDALIGSLPVQYEGTPNEKGYHEIVFMGVTHAYSLVKFV